MLPILTTELCMEYNDTSNMPLKEVYSGESKKRPNIEEVVPSDVHADSLENFAKKAEKEGATLVYAWPHVKKEGDTNINYIEMSAQKNGKIVSIFNIFDIQQDNNNINKMTNKYSSKVKKLVPESTKIITPNTLMREHAQKKAQNPNSHVIYKI